MAAKALADMAPLEMSRSAAEKSRIAFMVPPEKLSGGQYRPPLRLGLSHRDTVVLERERADAFAGRGRVGIEDRGGRDQNRGFTDAAPESAARHDDGFHFRHLGDAYRIVVVKVRLFDGTVLDRAFAVEQGR